MTTREQILDLAQLAHIELLTPNLPASVDFFTRLLGMSVTETKGSSVYLRAYEEAYHHSLKLTAADRPGLGHVAFRTRSAEALERRVKAIEARGLGRGWIEGDTGHGRAFQFDTPAGHRWELVWDVDYFDPGEADRSALRNRASKRPSHGVPVRRIDHFNLTAPDVAATRDFLCDALGGLAQHVAAAPDGLDVVLPAGGALASFLRSLQMNTSMIFSSGSSMPP
jgi:catechol 2,3-dioxygenase